jgi:predicted acylesterase/phospholipase RssA
MIPYRIYLSGGGICAMAHVGALLELSTHIELKTIREWMGVSAGAFVSMCLCVGYTLQELSDFCRHFDFCNIKEIDSIPGWLLHFGVDTGDRLHKLIDACLHVKGVSSDITFLECQEQFNYSLRIVATDLNEAVPIIFSPTDTPNYRISDAVRASMNVPYYFQPFVCPITSHYLVDGAVISNYPLFVLSKEEQARTISILIRTSVEKKETLEFEDFLLRPLNVLYVEKMNIESSFYPSRCIQIMLGQVDVMDFSLDEEAKDAIIQKGKEAVLEYMKQIPKPKRRNSIS